jgi:hypothetical protein
MDILRMATAVPDHSIGWADAGIHAPFPSMVADCAATLIHYLEKQTQRLRDRRIAECTWHPKPRL